MTVRNLATLDRDICQPLGRILQEAFADGFIGTGNISISHTIPAAALSTCWDGIYKFKTILDGDLGDSIVVGTHIGLKFTNNARIGLPGYASSALQIKLTSSGTPNLTGGDVAGIAFEYHIDETGGAPRTKSLFHVNAGTHNFSGLLHVMNNGDIGDDTNSSEPTWGTAHRRLPIMIANVTYYIHATAD